MIIAKQFSAIYDEVEDRLRLIVNINYPDRYDIWITRKFLIDIIDNIQTYLINNKLQAKNSTYNNNSSQKELPIYTPTNKPSLLKTLNITKNNDIFILTLKDENNTIRTTLTQEELKSFVDILIKPVKIKWGIGF